MNLTDLHVLSDAIQKVLDELIPKRVPVALFDFPNYSNVGDSAIWLGQLFYLEKIRHVRYLAVDSLTLSCFPDLPSSTVVLINGGGNLGDLWSRHQLFRENIIAHYRKNRIIQLPQSIFFENSSNEERCRKVFSAHADFNLLVRDLESLEKGRRLHSGSTQLCPDMALMLTGLTRSRDPSDPIVGLLRTDKEKITETMSLKKLAEFPVFDWVEEPKTALSQITSQLETIQAKYPRWTRSLYYPKQYLYRGLAKNRLRRGCQILSRGQVVITDRLHGHILCTLMGIPHVVLDNSYNKIGNFRGAWKTGKDYCLAAKTLEDAVVKAEFLLNTRYGPDSLGIRPSTT